MFLLAVLHTQDRSHTGGVFAVSSLDMRLDKFEDEQRQICHDQFYHSIHLQYPNCTLVHHKQI